MEVIKLSVMYVKNAPNRESKNQKLPYLRKFIKNAPNHESRNQKVTIFKNAQSRESRIAIC